MPPPPVGRIMSVIEFLSPVDLRPAALRSPLGIRLPVTVTFSSSSVAAFFVLGFVAQPATSAAPSAARRKYRFIVSVPRVRAAGGSQAQVYPSRRYDTRHRSRMGAMRLHTADGRPLVLRFSRRPAEQVEL